MDDFLIYEAPQGTEEWLEARAGKITASMVSVIRAKVNMPTEQQQKYIDSVLSGMTEAQALEAAKYKAKPRAAVIDKALSGEQVGEWSTAALDYAFRLAVERIAGVPLDEGFQTWAMKRGNELEPYARMAHEEVSGLIVQPTGFIATPDGKFGASADGFSNDGAGCEYKCFIAPDKLREFWFDFDPSCVMDQIQMGMWISGKKKWHLGVYCPALKDAGKELWLKTIDRDDDYIEKMESDLIEFERLVTEYEMKLRA